MANKPKLMSDEDIVTRVLAKSKESVSWYDSKLSLERTRVLRYYNSELPKRQGPGKSSYVSTDVYDSVEMMKAQILEVFAGGDEIAQFDADADMAEQDCKVATEYARWVIFRLNNGYEIFSSTIHDGLIARIGLIKVFWDEQYDYEDHEFSMLDADTVHGLASHPEVDSLDSDLDENTGLYSGKLKRKIDKSQVRIENVPPEEFLIAPRSVSLSKAPYVGHRTFKTKAELKADGYDPDLIDSIGDGDDKSIELNPEALERNEQVEDTYPLDDSIQPEQDRLTVYESYVRMDIHDGNGTQLWRIVHVRDVLLEKEAVDKAPFIAFVPLPVPHMLHGNNFAARVIPIQNARTVLTRGVLDHTAITTNPRWQVVKGGLPNPREMIENRLGGLVNVSRPDSVSAMQFPNLNPFIFQVLGMLKEDKEQSTGISSLSQGLNKDAISKQNSQGLVDNLVQLSGQRQKIIARNFAYGFFVPLMIEVIRLAILNDKSKTWLEVGGQPLQANPQDWAERKTCSVSMHLGYGDKAQAAANIATAYQQLAEDPTIAPMFTAQNRYNMIVDAMKLKALPANRYITPPQKTQPPQPDPMKTAEIAVKQKTADAAMLAAQASMMHEQTRANEGQVKAVHTQQKLETDTALKAHAEARKDLDVQHKINIDNREMDLAERTPVSHREAYVAPK